MLVPIPVIAAAGVPSLIWVAPFVALLLCVALLPLFHRTAHWWHANSSKLLVSIVCAGMVLAHYWTRGFGVHLHGDVTVAAARLLGVGIEAEPSGKGYSTIAGFPALMGAAINSMWEYTPFIVMLFSLYAIAGGIVVRGRLSAAPGAITALMAIGGVLASLVGTTGASVLLIRPLLKALQSRRNKVHTVVFFIFIVSNVGGTMLPIGDPPLFVGFLRGVPFLWTLSLWAPWVFMMGSLLAIYFVWDSMLWKKERREGYDASPIGAALTPEPVSVAGLINAVWLVLVVLCVATLAPGSQFPGTSWVVPPLLREGAMLGLVAVSFLTTAKGLRAENKFDWFPIAEVAALFLGIFVALQVPLEILSVRGGELGLTTAWQYFWATGALSAFLDNAPTYAVFFQTALSAPPPPAGVEMVTLANGSQIRDDFLAAVSLGAVFMGACTYIGNGPNFMVKAIAEEGGVKMPGFFGYMAYAAAVLVPLFVVLTVVFLT
ncbi:MAG: sodium:proton antiporter [Phycisphaerales bacterium]